ncbi:hypothetical protein [Caballeronia sp. dw_19]|jgi:hypothetical protein|uniref:DUF2471 family protein n=1 Tax=unclassified Caballeronia TaxID=2646786 RepID=UPI001BD6CAE9|nr:hypothetical protein [Caballeronia sp. dw_19]
MTDNEVEALELGQAALIADVKRVARVIVERYRAADADLTWHLLRDIEEETLCDLSLLARWPLESLLGLMSRSNIPPNEGAVSVEAATGLSGLPSFIYSMFQQARVELVF